MTAEQRRLRVLETMHDLGDIDDVEYLTAVAQPVWVYGQGAPPVTPTVVYPPETQQSSDPYFTDYVYRWLGEHLPGGVDQIYQGGLRIETTIDPVQQAAAQEQVAAFLDGTDPDLRTSLVAVEPPTGYVRAFVSGRDFAADQVNYALGADGGGSGRQPGSSFKPFVLAQALSEGITPDARYSGAPHQIGADVIENYDGAVYGSLDLRTATWKSVNTVYTRLILDAGVDKTMALAQAMGATGVRDYDPTVHGAAVALGVESVSPLDMASAYATLAARGAHAEPTPVLRVTDRDGEVIIDNSVPATTRVLEEGVADNVTAILQGVLTNGTAAGRGIGRPAAGKTGTTQENKDAWFVGYTPTLSTAVWIGYENKTVETARELTDIKGVRTVTGGTHPARIWQQFMEAALRDVPITEFTEPAPIVAVPDVVQIRERKGFEPGRRMYPTAAAGSGSYVEELGPPEADLPTTTTSTTEPTTTTTAPTTTTTSGGILN